VLAGSGRLPAVGHTPGAGVDGRAVCSLVPESALWPSRKVSGPSVAALREFTTYRRIFCFFPAQNVKRYASTDSPVRVRGRHRATLCSTALGRPGRPQARIWMTSITVPARSVPGGFGAQGALDVLVAVTRRPLVRASGRSPRCCRVSSGECWRRLSTALRVPRLGEVNGV
jgi:hypothetical protein